MPKATCRSPPPSTAELAALPSALPAAPAFWCRGLVFDSSGSALLGSYDGSFVARVSSTGWRGVYLNKWGSTPLAAVCGVALDSSDGALWVAQCSSGGANAMLKFDASRSLLFSKSVPRMPTAGGLVGPDSTGAVYLAYSDISTQGTSGIVKFAKDGGNRASGPRSQLAVHGAAGASTSCSLEGPRLPAVHSVVLHVASPLPIPSVQAPCQRLFPKLTGMQLLPAHPAPVL